MMSRVSGGGDSPGGGAHVGNGGANATREGGSDDDDHDDEGEPDQLLKAIERQVLLSLDKSVPEKLPPSLEAAAEQPPLFDGTTRLYISYTCPFAQRAWITRNLTICLDR
ncbi:hypothetical protein Tsubulata_051243 [Turnera subulata]|uniref:GST N-terminal domain-containing protein n=1 Tax=Turnera subulata TaxID=218843 RepID=A0A9Q0F7L9_9ROSI|nr:hypothetical protein Tsubulata_051243 [Turnera subulata]